MIGEKIHDRVFRPGRIAGSANEVRIRGFESRPCPLLADITRQKGGYMSQIRKDADIPQRRIGTELEVLIGNLNQTEDPLKEIEAQVEFITNELSEGRLALPQYVHRFSLLSQAESYYKNK